MFIIAFAGARGAGKGVASDAAYDELVGHFSNVEIVSFSRLLKNICSILLDWSFVKGLHWNSKHLEVPQNIHITDERLKRIVETITNTPYEPKRVADGFSDTHFSIKRRFMRGMINIGWFRNGRFYFNEAGMKYGRMLQLVGTEVMRAEFGNDVFVRHLFEKNKNEPAIIIDDVRFIEELDAVRAHGGTVVRILRVNHTPDSSDGRSDTHQSETAIDHIELPVLTNAGDETFLRAVADFTRTLLPTA